MPCIHVDNDTGVHMMFSNRFLLVCLQLRLITLNTITGLIMICLINFSLGVLKCISPLQLLCWREQSKMKRKEKKTQRIDQSGFFGLVLLITGSRSNYNNYSSPMERFPELQ